MSLRCWKFIPWAAVLGCVEQVEDHLTIGSGAFQCLFESSHQLFGRARIAPGAFELFEQAGVALQTFGRLIDVIIRLRQIVAECLSVHRPVPIG